MLQQILSSEKRLLKLIMNLILGVCILLRVWDQVVGFLIRLHNVTILG
jgi:hypothetical protein